MSSESVLSETIFLNPFLGIHVFGTRAKTNKYENSQNSSVSFLCGNGEDAGAHFLGATHFGVFDAIQFFGGGLWWGRGLAVKLGLVGLMGCDRECLRVCLEVLQNYDPRAEEPSIQFKGAIFLRT